MGRGIIEHLQGIDRVQLSDAVKNHLIHTAIDLSPKSSSRVQIILKPVKMVLRIWTDRLAAEYQISQCFIRGRILSDRCRSC